MSYCLTGDRVHTLLGECLSSADSRDVAVIHGVSRTFSVDLNKIAAAKSEIGQMLMQMADNFMLDGDKAGGWSFLNACVDRRGVQWTDLHSTVEELVVLGMASGLAFYTFSRDIWEVLPGGVPFFTIRGYEAARLAANYQSKLPVDA